MSQVVIDGKRFQVSREEYVAFCEAAAKKKCSVEEAARSALSPAKKKPAKKAAK